jgi:hypothetical protein
MKKVLALLMAGVMVVGLFSLAGCGGEEEEKGIDDYITLSDMHIAARQPVYAGNTVAVHHETHLHVTITNAGDNPIREVIISYEPIGFVSRTDGNPIPKQQYSRPEARSTIPPGGNDELRASIGSINAEDEREGVECTLKDIEGVRITNIYISDGGGFSQSFDVDIMVTEVRATRG